MGLSFSQANHWTLPRFWTMTGSSVLFSNSLLTYHPTTRCYKNCTAETVEIHGISTRLVHTSGLPHTKIRQKMITIYIRKLLSFRGTVPRSPDLNPLHFGLWGHLDPPPVYSAPTQNGEIFHQRSSTSVKPFATASRPLKVCDSP